jgi:hypothetical protein
VWFNFSERGKIGRKWRKKVKESGNAKRRKRKEMARDK